MEKTDNNFTFKGINNGNPTSLLKSKEAELVSIMVTHTYSNGFTETTIINKQPVSEPSTKSYDTYVRIEAVASDSWNKYRLFTWSKIAPNAEAFCSALDQLGTKDVIIEIDNQSFTGNIDLERSRVTRVRSLMDYVKKTYGNITGKKVIFTFDILTKKIIMEIL